MSGLFGSRPKTSTATKTEKSTSTTSPTRTGRQENVYNEIIRQLTAVINQGPNPTADEIANMRGRLGHTYGQIAPRLGIALTSRGMGPGTGKQMSTSSLRGVDLALGNQRAASLSALKDFTRRRQMQDMGLALPFTQPEIQTTTREGTSTGSETTPGPSLFDQLLGYAGQGLGIASMLGAFSPGGGGFFNAAGTGGASGPGYNLPPGYLNGIQSPFNAAGIGPAGGTGYNFQYLI
jgi:hypothetical protein